jgi:hypothetical protein
MPLGWGSAAAAAAAVAAAAAAAASPAPVDCITGSCREAWGAFAGRVFPRAWLRKAGLVALRGGRAHYPRSWWLGQLHLARGVRGYSARAGQPFLRLGEGYEPVGWGRAKQQSLWLPRPSSAAGAQWAAVPTRPPIGALDGESLNLTPLWREKQA